VLIQVLSATETQTCVVWGPQTQLYNGVPMILFSSEGSASFVCRNTANPKSAIRVSAWRKQVHTTRFTGNLHGPCFIDQQATKEEKKKRRDTCYYPNSRKRGAKSETRGQRTSYLAGLRLFKKRVSAKDRVEVDRTTQTRNVLAMNKFGTVQPRNADRRSPSKIQSLLNRENGFGCSSGLDGLAPRTAVLCEYSLQISFDEFHDQGNLFPCL
jgi:hypothetical protein